MDNVASHQDFSGQYSDRIAPAAENARILRASLRSSTILLAFPAASALKTTPQDWPEKIF
jgi:hypothetical protein